MWQIILCKKNVNLPTSSISISLEYISLKNYKREQEYSFDIFHIVKDFIKLKYLLNQSWRTGGSQTLFPHSLSVIPSTALKFPRLLNKWSFNQL